MKYVYVSGEYPEDGDWCVVEVEESLSDLKAIKVGVEKAQKRLGYEGDEEWEPMIAREADPSEVVTFLYPHEELYAEIVLKLLEACGDDLEWALAKIRHDEFDQPDIDAAMEWLRLLAPMSARDEDEEGQ